MIKKVSKGVGIALVYLLLWQLISMLIGNELLFPSPIRTAVAIGELMATAEFYESVGLTMLRVTAGYFLGILVGCMLGVFTAFSGAAESLLKPLRTIIKATPVASFILLLILYLSSSLAPVFIVFLMVIPIAWTNMMEGIVSADPLIAEMSKAFNVPFIKRLFKFYLPSAYPQFIAACTTSLGFAWKSGVAAEVLANSDISIGKGLYESKLYLETPALFAWTAVVIVLSIIIERIVVNLLRRSVNDKI